MKKCLKKICDCLVPDDVFKCLKINVLTLTMRQPDDFTQEEFKKLDKKILDKYICHSQSEKSKVDTKYSAQIKHYQKHQSHLLMPKNNLEQ
jgi:hypothetical protein